jgi:hypothetical protein
MTPRDNPTRTQIAFYLLVIAVGLLIVGRLDYADQVITENQTLRAQLDTARIQCSTDRSDHLSYQLSYQHSEI